MNDAGYDEYEIGEYESLPQRFRAVRYDGINNDKVEMLMTAECTVTQLQGSRALLLRRPTMPDHVIQVGDWVTVGDDLHINVSSIPKGKPWKLLTAR